MVAGHESAEPWWDVPFRLPRSSSMYRSPSLVIRACFRETFASGVDLGQVDLGERGKIDVPAADEADGLYTENRDRRTAPV